jgi:LmbE family N-acetylglucosaminyl deacetylase
MRQEAELVPYETTRLTGSPLLAIAPHPDDEIFGCGAITHAAARAGREVHIVVVTDGAAQGDAEVRRAESREAARRLGTPDPDFWGLSDRGLESDLPELRDRIKHTLQKTRPELVLVPSPAELHPDHRAVGLATYDILRNEPRITVNPEFRLAAYEVSAFLRPNTLVDLSACWAHISHAAQAFASQNVMRPYLEVLEAMAVARRLTLPEGVSHAAGFFVVDGEFIAGHDVRTWAEHIGPSAGLELDGAGAAHGAAQPGLLDRLFGGRRGSTSG